MRHMRSFDKNEAKQYIDRLLKKHKITVVAWSATSCGWALVKKREIKIPQPTNVDRFGVCLHEIFHIIGRKGSKSFEQEFYCDEYALNTLIDLGFETEAWIRRMKWHSLSRIAMAHNRGLNHSGINQDIRTFFSEVDFNKWIGNKVFVQCDKTNELGYTISLTANISKDEIERQLNRQGLILDKSFADDSTNGLWIVKANGDKYGVEYGNLSEIINRYQLTL